MGHQLLAPLNHSICNNDGKGSNKAHRRHGWRCTVLQLGPALAETLAMIRYPMPVRANRTVHATNKEQRT